MKLYEIAEEMESIEELLDELAEAEGTGEITEDSLLEALVEAMDAAELSMQDKITNCVKMIRTWEASETALKNEESRLYARRKSFVAKQTRLRTYMLGQLQRVDSPTMKMDIATVGRAKGRESAIIDDELNLPQGYFKTELLVKPEKTELKKLWALTPEEERGALPGFHVERGPESLMIR